ncbi:MAG: response regulator [Phycisphaerae bacterium]|nr:response regulator [Phycisphaerae bacterium]
MGKSYSTRAVADLLGVSVGSVANWIDQERLRAGRTPGGHRRVTAADLAAFIRQQNLPMPAELQRNSRRILVVDDDPAVRQWLVQMIQAALPDWEVIEAPDGYAAGELVGSRKPDVVLLDLNMPGVDGFEVCRRIKGNQDTRHANVIAISGEFSPDRQAAIRDCGASAFLAKPLIAGEVLKAIHSAVAS